MSAVARSRPETAAITIVGGGIMAATLAYQLARRGIGEVVVLERETVASGSIGRATGGLRQQFADELDIIFAHEGLHFYQRFIAEMQAETALAAPPPPPFYQYGYLFLVSNNERWRAMQGYVALQRRLGVPTELLTPEEVVARWPGLRLVTEDLCGATFCPTDGYTDPAAMTRALLGTARRLGVSVYEHSPVVAIQVARGRVQAVETPQRRLLTPLVINATGAYAALTARLAGINDLPVYPLRRQLYLCEAVPGLPQALPMVVDQATGLHFRWREGDLLVGLPHSPSPDEEAASLALAPTAFDLTLDPAVWSQIKQAIAHRFPALAGLHLRRAWAGLYEMTPDEHPILGPTEVEGFLCACGFSGHGFMHAPLAAQLLIDYITTGKSSALDIALFSLQRFREGRLLPATRLL
ncbi:NAD(P)/FAD-dependent oxidoreductase [Thermogemmatispora sp.]|uniref:NAD(P)/FAD-dependent oxidoreductase n=1 Tax=Thermogemmatispora sp. TaxID=1968838 RepID=UPI001DFF6F96|nr:FAD-dependent oxidoreductase [Thermogemmatispora sp.]MBX5448886.1 FAD-binding oxidoreductase [Thermogemmatispora sp.]